MSAKLKYYVYIDDPEMAKSAPNGGWALGIPKMVERGQERDLTDGEMFDFIKLRRDNNNTDLDFDGSFSGITFLEFKINPSSDWNFQQTPFEVRPGSGNPSRNERITSKFAKLNLPQATNSKKEHKYTLLYIDPAAPTPNTFEHDPIVRNGTVPPGGGGGGGGIMPRLRQIIIPLILMTVGAILGIAAYAAFTAG